jgi:hypothetical protein
MRWKADMRRIRGVLGMGVVLALAACAGCSSDRSSAGFDAGASSDAAAEAGPTAAQACTDFATAVCGRLQACAPFGVQTLYGDLTTCVQRMALACSPSLGAAGSAITPAKLDACAQAIGAETCDEAFDNAQPAACNVPGTLENGAACGSDAQCQSGRCRITAPGTVCGTCAQRAAAGGSCGVDADCAAGLVCVIGSGGGAGTCTMPSTAGASCSAGQPCLRTLTCIGGTCQTPLPAGAACSSASDCAAGQGLYCDPQSKTCKQAQTATAGQPCLDVNGDFTVCTASTFCVDADGGPEGTCHPTAADGDPCGPGVDCMPPAICSKQARCLLPDPSSCR